MTAGAMAEDRERCLAAGMDDFLPKPVDFDDLERVLAAWMDAAHGAGDTAPDAGDAEHVAADPSHDADDVEGVPDTAPEERVLALTGTQLAEVLDPRRLDVLRDLGPDDGRGLLPAAAEAFRREAEAGARALRAAAQDGGGERLRQAAHRLKGSASNIGATEAALEALGRSGGQPDPALLDRLDAELGRVDAALNRMLEAGP